MTHLSPAVFGMWSVSGVLLTSFCFYHLWHYDRFKCLRINHGPYSGAFKRLMTYTYLLTLPTITVYSVGNAVIKYQEGFIFHPHFGVLPKPYTEWSKAHRDAIFPLTMLFSIGFSLEMTTHLEELCFWLFLMRATASSQDWFKSTYFLIWSCGSLTALIYVPTVSVVFRNDPLKNEAYTFLAGSIGSLALTLSFVPILYSFPGFLRDLVRQGVDNATVIRLRKFHELNQLRIVFRLLFVVPLVILGIDGTKPHGHPINESVVLTDIFGMVSAFGCLVSSAITLLIFFPRNSKTEYESSHLGRLGRLKTTQQKGEGHNRQETLDRQLSFSSRSEVEDGYGTPLRYQTPSIRKVEPDHNGERSGRFFASLPSVASSTPLRPNRLGLNGDVELGSVQDIPTTAGWVNHWTSQFKSPLDVMERRAY